MPFATGFQDALNVLKQFSEDPQTVPTLETIADVLVQALENGNKVMICGNGGSMADAMHFAEECTGRFRADREPYPVLAFSDPTHLSCVSNDYGYEQVFSRMVQAFGRAGDVLILLTTSGNSTNLLRAAESARSLGVATVGFVGRGGGALRPLCDHVLDAPGDTSDRIQELHMMALHLLVEAIELQRERLRS